MKITRLAAVGILAAIMLISCSSISPLTEEEAAMLVEGTVFEPDETEKTVYVPVETVRYVIIDSNNSNRSQNDNATDIPKDTATSGDYLNSSVDSNTVSVGSETDFTNALEEVKNSEIQANETKSYNIPLLDPASLKGSPVKKEKTTIYGATEWTLKNGLKVVVLPTEYEKDQVMMLI